MIPARTILAHWCDPRNGDWITIEEFHGKKYQTFAPPSRGDQDDWVLVLDDSARNFPTD
jgi:hypothetical protein